MTSTALILRPQQETALYLRRGPGLSVYQFADSVARSVISPILNFLYCGPRNAKDQIDNFFLKDKAREAVLNELYKADLVTLSKRHKKLRNHCRDLLKYANSQSQTVDTQLVTFKILITVITRYPGTRRLFHHLKTCGQALSTFKENWTRAHQDCGKGWDFYLDYTLHCLSDSELTALVEKELPSELGRLKLPEDDDDWSSKVPIEELLSFCSTISEYNYTKLGAIRYLAGILELPTFWEKGVSVQKRFSDILAVLCYTIFELIQDTEKNDDVDVDVNGDSPPWMSATRDAADFLASATFDGLLWLHGCDQLVSPCPPQLSSIVDLLQRSGMEEAFPKASDRAPRVNQILQRIERETTDHQANSPVLTTHLTSVEHNLSTQKDEYLDVESSTPTPCIEDETEEGSLIIEPLSTPRVYGSMHSDVNEAASISESAAVFTPEISRLSQASPDPAYRSVYSKLDSLYNDHFSSESSELRSDDILPEIHCDPDPQLQAPFINTVPTEVMSSLPPGLTSESHGTSMKGAEAGHLDELSQSTTSEPKGITSSDNSADPSPSSIQDGVIEGAGVRFQTQEPKTLPGDQTKMLRSEDIIVALIGPSGTGKSSFVNTVMGKDVAKVGDGYESCTQQVHAYGCIHPDGSGRKVILVDTPGFNDTYRFEFDVLKDLAKWLAKTYRKKITLSGILFFHKIEDSRMRGSSIRSLHMFQALCGENALCNVVLTTTYWDRVSSDIGASRESILQLKFWKLFIDQGSRVARFQPRTYEAAWNLIDLFSTFLNSPNASPKPRQPLQIETELVTDGEPLDQTADYVFLLGWWTDLISKLKQASGSKTDRFERAEKQKKKLEYRNSPGSPLDSESSLINVDLVTTRLLIDPS